ncbi:hypothetical protein RP20_CCG025911 [Aedes albopictus]|nr:hypothetical protein RP20_CCG025911 [Aedes albopictus]
MASEKLVPDATGAAGEEEQVGFMTSVMNEILHSPLNLLLVLIITVLVYKIFRSQKQPAAGPPPEPELPRLRRDFTVAELLQYDGKQPDGRVLVAVNGSVYDVTKGKRFYGPGECSYIIHVQFRNSARFQPNSPRVSVCLDGGSV